jgi:hypothetical protein
MSSENLQGGALPTQPAARPIDSVTGFGALGRDGLLEECEPSA